MKHKDRRAYDNLVFVSNGKLGPRDYNLWRGLKAAARQGWSKQLKLLRHIREVICKRDKVKFKYLMRWLAFAIQHPTENAAVAVVLMSTVEGSGKSALGEIMLSLFGKGRGGHGWLIDDAKQLLGEYNSHMETASFVLAEEILWAGDPKTSDALKSRITSSTIPCTEKFQGRWQASNPLHLMMTTNHEWAINAGEGARRFFVLEVSDEHVGDKAWFDRLHSDLEDGGREQFLWLLQSLKLGNWHPRQVPITDETKQQQILSAPPVMQWLLACAQSESVVGIPGGAVLNKWYSTHALHEACCNYLKTHGGRGPHLVPFGKALTKAGINACREPNTKNGPPGYNLPTPRQLKTGVFTLLRIIHSFSG
jgi:hypothetical protein